LKNVGLPIEYEKVQSGLKNILVIGNIGNGKSTIQNKIAHMIKYGKENIQDLEKVFAAKKSIKSVTMGIHSIDIKNQYRLVDS
jgi:stage III sporulation protein SpoIIIAA